MALSTRTKTYLAIALADQTASAEVAAAVGSALSSQAADVAAITTANATDLTTAEALANQTKTTVNAILAALKAAGIMA